eukprot:1054550-Pyramimonas_sp.AAC.1
MPNSAMTSSAKNAKSILPVKRCAHGRCAWREQPLERAGKICCATLWPIALASAVDPLASNWSKVA